jgi:4-alpha-glucanotransferase
MERAAFDLPRSSGVQLHVTSLPSGTLGPDAFAFVDWLAEAGQSWWQVLPLGPPDRQRSPYRSASAFAAWPGLLADPEAEVAPEEIEDFRRREASWIGPWEAYGGPRAVADQVRFSREWGMLRAYASERGVRLIGDLPIYVAPDSADHRAFPELFRGGAVAGAPPDAYTRDGQLWGNPLYDWPALRRRGYHWWIERLRRTFELFDVARIDHFRGFTAYWAVPEGARTAAAGSWRRGPGAAVFEAASAELGTLPVIAENLGVITPPVERLRHRLGFPGMTVLQFAFDGNPANLNALDAQEELGVVYTGTHDSDTLPGWWGSLSAAAREPVLDALRDAGFGDDEPAWGLMRLAFSSPGALAMTQAQDVLGLGSVARMNTPGKASGNWRWKLAPGQLTAADAQRLRAVTAESGRLRAGRLPAGLA